MRPTRERLNRLLRSTSALLDKFSAVPESASEIDDDFEVTDIEAAEQVDSQFPKLGSFAIMMRSIDIAQAALARHQMAAYPPDLLIEVPRTACRSLDFHRAAEVIELGHQLAARALDGLDDRPVDTTHPPG